MPVFKMNNQVEITGRDEDFTSFVLSSLTMWNPEYEEASRMGRYCAHIPKKLYFFKKENESIFVPRGFIFNLVEYCKEKNIPFRFKNQTKVFHPVDFVFHGTLKPFQKDSLEIMLQQEQGTLCAPTGAGKTVMALYMIAQRKQPTLIIIHTKELLNQWRERISTFLKISKDQIGKVGDGHLEVKQITVALVQTLRNHPEIVNEFGYLIIDEAHRCPAKIFTVIVSCYKGRYLNGLSATPFRSDKLTKVIGWYAGKVLVKIKPQQLIEEGHIVGVEAIIRNTFFHSELDNPADQYSSLLWELSRDPERNVMIVEDVIKEVGRGETCLVLTDRKVHCEELRSLIAERSKIKTAVLIGSVASKERKKIIEKVNSGSIKVLIATGNLIGEGFDCKNLSALFLTLPVKFSGRIIQYVGRVLRTKEGKDKAKIYDYFDPNVPVLYSSLKNREREYKKLSLKGGK